MQEGMVVLKVQDSLYKIHRYLLEHHSDFVRGVLAENTDTLGRSDEHPLPLPADVTQAGFDCLLEFLYHGIYDPSSVSLGDWTTILRVSTRLQCAKVRQYAIRELSARRSSLPAIEAIVLAREYDIPAWLGPAYAELVRAVGQKHTRVARLRIAPEPTTDPERERLELEKAAARKPRKSRGGEDDGFGATRRRHEYGDEDRKGKRRKDAEGGERKGPGEYQTDDFLVPDTGLVVHHLPVVVSLEATWGTHSRGYRGEEEWSAHCYTHVYPFASSYIDLWNEKGDNENIPFFCLDLSQALFEAGGGGQVETCNYVGNEAQAWREDSVYLSYALVVLKADGEGVSTKHTGRENLQASNVE
ncbi:hypothetical protein NUW54_g11918 [Trametes sanguinea]|uniref:Uncharacterized protein n=1 Tax=Trametes sanguinea TaxID=158606 RepID=A0ACC1N736_9APHY|nr:hypothetical protein NUW54_g11918 [Trametes sanguinea]